MCEYMPMVAVRMDGGWHWTSRGLTYPTLDEARKALADEVMDAMDEAGELPTEAACNAAESELRGLAERAKTAEMYDGDDVNPPLVSDSLGRAWRIAKMEVVN